MKVHLVVAHLEKNSFNLALHQVAIDLLESKSIKFNVTDLYMDKFNPVAGHHDINDFPEQEHFNLAKAQRWAHKNNAFVEPIKIEQSKLAATDTLILQFPL